MGLLDDNQRGLLAMQHNVDPRYKAAARAPAANAVRGLLNAFTPQNVAQLGLEMLPGAGDFAAARDSAQAGQEMVNSFKAGDYGGAASSGLLSLLAGVGVFPAIPALGGIVKRASDLPMDEASRMARADEVLRVPGGRAEAFDSARTNAAKPVSEGGLGLPPDNTAEMRAEAMGFDVDAFHASRATEPFDAFRPGMWGSTYLAATPNRAVNGASAGAQELAHLSGPTDGRAAVSIMPLKVRGDDIATLRPPRDAWDALPDTAKESDIGDLARKVGASHWWDVYDEVAIKPPKWDEADKLIDAGEFEYRKRPYPAQEYTAGAKPWQDSERLLPGYNSGSDVSSLARVARDGQRGFLVADEAGASIVAGPGMPIRSRFAAFDPKNINSSDLLAGIAGAGLLGIGASTWDEPKSNSGL